MSNKSENPQEKKQQSTGWSPKIISNLITALIAAVALIIGSLIGERGATRDANIQLTNVYVPIHATQTAEAKIRLDMTLAVPSPTLTPTPSPIPSPTLATALQISVPISKIIVKGENIGNSSDIGNSHMGEFELVSKQAENTFTDYKTPLIYTWESPGILPELNRLPMRGIQSTITISPMSASDEQELVLCHYVLPYNSYPYTSVEQFIPYNQPTALLWDFTGRMDPTWFMKSEENKDYVKKADDIIRQENIGFSEYSTKLRELWQWQYLVGTTDYDPGSIKRIDVFCNVSATKEYVGGKAGDIFTFKGKFTFGDVIVYPNEKPK
jgi:hypothetical protein